MFALKPALSIGSRRAPGGTRPSRPSEHMVLPRWLRRPARMLKRLGTGDFVPPRYAATAAAALLFAATGAYGAAIGERGPEIVQAVTARSGFAVEQIRVVGHRETSEIDVLDQLGLDGWTSLIGFNVDAARDRIRQLPWVEAATVRKVYPNAIEVRITERKAFAVWQHEKTLSVIGEKGNVIAPVTTARFNALPLVVGEAANEQASAFLTRVAAFPDFAGRVKGYVHVGGRRWDLRLDNGVAIRLPEGNEEAAITALIAEDRRSGILNRDVASIDMRFDDRIVMQLSQEAVKVREADIDKAKKAKRREAHA